MKKIALLTAVCMVLLLCACGAGTDTKKDTSTATYHQISQEEAAEMMKNEKDPIILDVRTPQEFNSGHIPNAICIPNEIIGTADIPQLPDKDQVILVYCRSGRRSKDASQKLADNGYTNVYEFGGIINWKGEIVKR